MKKYNVIASYKDGSKVNYYYEGDGEYLGKFETVEDRIKRHFTKKNILSYEVVIC